MPGTAHIVELEASPGRWRFASAPPDADFAGVVVEYWEVEGQLAPFREKVLPNGRMELMINLGQPHRIVTNRGTLEWEHAWLSGLHEQSITIESTGGTHLVSVRLHPLGALALFGYAVTNTANSVVDLERVIGPTARELRRRLLHVDSVDARFRLLEQHVRTYFGASKLPSAIMRAAALRIEAAHGNLRISELHAEQGVSRKHLWALFTREMGMSPKRYAQIQRFVWTLARVRECTTADWSQLANEAGYSDQSHLVRDFQRVAGVNPTTFLRQVTPDGTALL